MQVYVMQVKLWGIHESRGMHFLSAGKGGPDGLTVLEPEGRGPERDGYPGHGLALPF